MSRASAIPEVVLLSLLMCSRSFSGVPRRHRSYKRHLASASEGEEVRAPRSFSPKMNHRSFYILLLSGGRFPESILKETKCSGTSTSDIICQKHLRMFPPLAACMSSTVILVTRVDPSYSRPSTSSTSAASLGTVGTLLPNLQ